MAFALMAALGLDAADPELDLESYLNARGQQLVEQGQDLCLVSVDGFGTLIDTAFSHLDDYVTSTNPLDTPAWQARLADTRLGQAAPSAPVFQYHALVDEIVPFQQAADLRRTWCDQGADVSWSVQPLAEHALGFVQGLTPAVTWLSARFAGQPTSPNCHQASV